MKIRLQHEDGSITDLQVTEEVIDCGIVKYLDNYYYYNSSYSTHYHVSVFVQTDVFVIHS